MKYNRDNHHRRSIRLKGYDYSQAGWYSITICTRNRLCLFGEIQNGEMVLNDAGMMVQTVWNEIGPHYPGIATDSFIVMPNHVHGIVLVGAGPRACPDPANCETDPRACPNPANYETGQIETGQPVGVSPRGYPKPSQPEKGQPVGATPRGCPIPKSGQAQGPAPTIVPNTMTIPKMSLPDIVHRFKTMTTKRYTDGVKQNGWAPFAGKLWQRNYYEHIIRDDASYNRISEYIQTNPLRWQDDKYYKMVGAGPCACPDLGLAWPTK